MPVAFAEGMRRLTTRGLLASIALVLLAGGCSREIAMTPAGRTVRTLRDASPCELVGDVSAPSARRGNIRREVRNRAGEMGATHIVQNPQSLAGGPRGWRAYRCDPDDLLRAQDLTHHQQVTEQHPEWAELDLDELADVRDGYWVQTGLASTLLVVGVGGLATGLAVFIGNVGRLPSCLGVCIFSGGSSGTPGNDEGMLMGAGIAVAGALVLVGSIVWLVGSERTRRAAARLREVNERLMLDADVSAHGAALRLRGTF